MVASTLARLIGSHEAETQADLGRLTALARTTVAAALDVLERSGVIRCVGSRPTPGRGRPADRLGLNPRFGLVLVADLGAHAGRLSIHDLGEDLLAARNVRLAVTDGPISVLARVTADFRAMLAEVQASTRPLVFVVGLPGPMDTRRGMPVKPPIMPGWDACG